MLADFASVVDARRVVAATRIYKERE